jgi:glycogen debranching enzyme
MAGNTVSILEGNTFVVSDLRGDIDATPTDTTGLFAFDTRYLSRWRLTVNGKTPNSLSTDDLQYFSAQFFLVPGPGTIYVDADLSIIRKRAVGKGFHEDLTFLNHSEKAVDLEVKIEAGSDFADLFEVKDKLAKKGECYTSVTDGRLVLGYRRESYERETWITSSVPAEFANTDTDTPTLTYHVHIGPHEQWSTGLDVSLGKIIKGLG